MSMSTASICRTNDLQLISDFFGSGNRTNSDYLRDEIFKMSQENRSFPSGATVATVAGIGICMIAVKYRTQILKQIKNIINYNYPLRNQQIHVLANIEECRSLMRNLKTYVKLNVFESKSDHN